MIKHIARLILVIAILVAIVGVLWTIMRLASNKGRRFDQSGPVPPRAAEGLSPRDGSKLRARVVVPLKHSGLIYRTRADRRSIYRAVWAMRLREPCRLSLRVSLFHHENLPSRPASTRLSLSIFRSDAVLAIHRASNLLRNDGP